MRQNDKYTCWLFLLGLFSAETLGTKICNVEPSHCGWLLNCDSDGCFSSCTGLDDEYYGSPNLSPIWCIVCVAPQICSDWTVRGCSNGALLFRNEFCCLANCAICNQTQCLNCAQPNAQYINGFGCTDCTANQICQNSSLVGCSVGFYLSGNDCIPCSGGCVACTAGGACLTTICSSTSYYINNATCQLCSLPLICSNYQLISCQPHNAYYLSSNNWVACGGQKVCQNCQLIGCQGAYYLSGNTCTACYQSECATCSSRYYCQSCIVNYSLYLNQYCCHDQCAQCCYSACHRCVSPSSQYISGKTCLSCNSPQICQNSQLVSCEDGYELINSACVLCTACALPSCPSYGMAQYVFQSGTCTICDFNTNCDNDQITSCVPDTQYYMKQNQCVYCSLPEICTNSIVTSCAGAHYLFGSSCFGCYSRQCATCSSQFYCSTCPSALYTYQQNQYCCAPNCLTCNHLTCDACVDGTRFYAYGPNCVPCISEICSQSIIIGCISGYYLFNNTCNACRPNCVSCTATACLECTSLTGFYIQGKNCLVCVLKICVNNQITPACISGYYYQSANCYQCPIQCPTCTSSSCLTCISPCQTCSMSTCLTCINNRQYVSATTTCTDCPSQCLTCTSTQCMTCLPPCSTCNHTQCLSCVSTNYYIQGTQCMICGQFCATCIATACQSCMYSNQYIQGINCVNCPNWCSTCNSSQCLTCQTPCLTCSITGCLSCISNSYYIQNNNCVNCGVNCLTCDQTQCLTCLYSNQYLSQHTCITCPSHCSQCTSSECTECSGSCATCNFTGCLSCLQQNQYPLGGTCINCPEQCQTCNQNTCLTCVPPCGVCDFNGCIMCLIEKIKFTTPDGESVQACQYANCYGLHWAYGQQCNDGNSNSNDGCTNCIIDKGYACQNYHDQPSKCLLLPQNCNTGSIIQLSVICNNCLDSYYLNENECSQCPTQCLTCDHEQKCLTCKFPSINTNMCQTCESQIGYYSDNINNECYTICGDAITAGQEQCDDGNVYIRDGCTNCQIDTGWYLEGSVFQPIIYPVPLIRQAFTLELYNNTRTFTITYNVPIQQIDLSQLIQINLSKLFDITWIQAQDTQLFIFNIQLQESCLNQSLLINFTNVSAIFSQLNFHQQLESHSILIFDYILVSQQTKELTEASRRIVDYLLVVLAIIALSALLFGGLESFWNLLDLLQIISYLQYINTIKPYNLDEFINLFGFIQLQNIMNSEYLNKDVLVLDSSQTAPYLIAKDGITCSTLFNIVPLLLPWLISLMTFYLTKIINTISQKIDIPLLDEDESRWHQLKFTIVQLQHLVNKICRSIESTFIYNGILVTFQSSVYDLCFVIVLGLYGFGTNIIDQVLTMSLVVIYFISIGALTLISSLNKITLKNQQKQFGRLLENTKFNNSGLYFSSFILLKKFLFMVFLVLLYNSPLHQSLSIALLSMAQILYLLLLDPLVNRFENIKQISCEIILFMTQLQLSCLVIDDQYRYFTYEQRDMIGWSTIFSILLIIIFQVLFDVIQQIPVYRKIYIIVKKFIEKSSIKNKQTTDLFI